LIKQNFIIKRLALLPELSNNTIGYIFASNPDINISTKEKVFDNVVPFYNRFKDNKPEIEFIEDELEKEIKRWSEKDLRIKSIRISGIRGIPISDKPFGIDFTDHEDEPQSMIILEEILLNRDLWYSEYLFNKTIGGKSGHRLGTR
jgi:hypothetical protein